MKKIAYIGYNSHKKTLSTQFLIERLKKNYEINFFWSLPSRYKIDIPLHRLRTDDYHAIILFQIFPTLTELKSFKCQNITLIPMLDDDLTISYSKWRSYYPYKFINFSKTLYEKLNFLGVTNNLYLQYAPDNITIKKTLPKKRFKNKAKIFFWQRSSEINWNLIKKLLHKKQIESIHMHRVESEIAKDKWFEKPSPKDIKEYNITFSSWFESKNDLLVKINECDIFFVPRLYEGIGQTFLEAMALSKCVISPDFPTMNEYINHSENGILFNLNKPSKIDISEHKLIGKNAKKSILILRNKWKTDQQKIIPFIDQNLSNPSDNIEFDKNLSNLCKTDVFQHLPFLLSDFKIDDNTDIIKSNGLDFSKYLNILHNHLKSLEVKDNSLVLYGAGTGAELIISIIPKKISYLVDFDPSKQGKKLSNKKIYSLEKLKNNNDKILISLFGRFEKITQFLCEKHEIDKERIIYLNL